MSKKVYWILCGLPLFIYLTISLLLHFGQTRLIFKPDSLIKSTPQKYGLDFQDVWIDVEQDQIHGWWIPHSQKSVPVILYFHGNASNNGDVTDMAQVFHDLGLSTLLIDYRGYGKSSSIFPNESRVYEDAIATWNYLTNKRQIKAADIFVYGHSLGGAVAIELARQHPELAGLITEGTFTSVQTLAQHNRFLRIFPLNWIINQCFDSINKIKSLQTPMLIIHGTEDEIIPVTMAAELFISKPEPKQLVIIPQAGHTNVHEVQDQNYFSSLDKFIRRNSEITNSEK